MPSAKSLTAAEKRAAEEGSMFVQYQPSVLANAPADNESMVSVGASGTAEVVLLEMDELTRTTGSSAGGRNTAESGGLLDKLFHCADEGNDLMLSPRGKEDYNYTYSDEGRDEDDLVALVCSNDFEEVRREEEEKRLQREREMDRKRRKKEKPLPVVEIPTVNDGSVSSRNKNDVVEKNNDAEKESPSKAINAGSSDDDSGIAMTKTISALTNPQQQWSSWW